MGQRYERELTAGERAELREDLRQFGPIYPVLKDRNGVTLNGHEVEALCAELDLRPEVKVVDGLPEEPEARRHFILKLNKGSYRHKSQEQMREKVASELRLAPDLSDRAVGELFGVDHKTVGAVRRELIGGGEIPHLKESRGLDGKRYKVRSISTTTKKEEETARRIIGGLGDTAGPVSYRRARRLEMARRYELLKEEWKVKCPTDPDGIYIRHCDFREWKSIHRETINVIFTDPPYQRKALPLVKKQQASTGKRCSCGAV